MKSLSTLIKLQKTHVDEQRLHVAKLQARLDDIDQQIASLEIQKTREQIVAGNNPLARSTYGAFLQTTIKKARTLEKERFVAVQAVEAGRVRLAELFEEQKRYEIAEAAREAAQEKEQQRRERIDMDEIGGIGHARKRDQ